MKNNIKKLSIMLLIAINQIMFSQGINLGGFPIEEETNPHQLGIALFNHAPAAFPQQFHPEDQRNFITDLIRQTFLTIAPVLRSLKCHIEKDDFLAPHVTIGEHQQPASRSFKDFKSATFKFIELSYFNSIEEMNGGLMAFLTDLAGGLDRDLFDESVVIPADSTLKGRTAKDFCDAVHIVPVLDMDD